MEKYPYNKKSFFALISFLMIIGWIFSGWPRIFNIPPKIQQAHAAMPTFVASGSQASGTGAITPALPLGIAANDILLLFVETANQAAAITKQAGGIWAEVANSPQGVEVDGSTNATRLTVFWSRYNGIQTAPTVGDSGDHTIGIIIAIRGVTTSGNPWDVAAGSTDAFPDTLGSIPGALTTVADTFIVAAITTNVPDANGTNVFSSWANASLTNVTERFDVSRTAGNGGGIGIAIGEKATAGIYGNTTMTISVLAARAMMSLALKPEPPVNSPPNTPILAEIPAFPNEQTPDTTPVLGNFSAIDPEENAIEYEIQWDEDFNFGSPITNLSSNFPGDAGWGAATFASGASVSYTIQAADALVNNQVYWWRVRARDPSGSNTWSAYSLKRSIAADTTLTQEQWFQTTGDQFNTGTLNDTDVTLGEIKLKGW